MSVLKDILFACEQGPKVTLYEPFLQHFGDIDYACILSEICIHSEKSMQMDPGQQGWFRRSYEAWEIQTGIPASRARKVCIDLAEMSFVNIEIRQKVSHFRVVPSSVKRLIQHLLPREYSWIIGKCPECGLEVLEGTRSFYCSSWKRHKQGNAAEKCPFTVWKDTLVRNGKPELTVNEMKSLLAGDAIELSLTSCNSNRIFSCKGVLHKRENGKYGIKFVFPERGDGKKPAFGLHGKQSVNRTASRG